MSDKVEATFHDPLLFPLESMALTMALAQLERDGKVMANTANICILALARLVEREQPIKEVRNG